MGALILGIVLIIGYHYQTNNPVSRIKFARRNGYHIYFAAGFSGLVLLGFSTLIWLVIDYYNVASFLVGYTNIQTTLAFLNDYEQWNNLKAVAVSLLMFILSHLIVKFSTWYYKKRENQYFKKLLYVVNDFEKLIILATLNTQLIRVELDCGKVYVGIPESPDLENGVITHLTIIPFLSGYRDEKKSILFTNDYQVHYEKLVSDNLIRGDIREVISEFMIVLPAETIVIASNFDLDAYDVIHNHTIKSNGDE